MGCEVGGRFKGEGTYTCLWLIHIDVWQRPTHYCKAIILQLQTNFKKRVIKFFFFSNLKLTLKKAFILDKWELFAKSQHPLTGGLSQQSSDMAVRKQQWKTSFFEVTV